MGPRTCVHRRMHKAYVPCSARPCHLSGRRGQKQVRQVSARASGVFPWFGMACKCLALSFADSSRDFSRVTTWKLQRSLLRAMKCDASCLVWTPSNQAGTVFSITSFKTSRKSRHTNTATALCANPGGADEDSLFQCKCCNVGGGAMLARVAGGIAGGVEDAKAVLFSYIGDGSSSSTRLESSTKDARGDIEEAQVQVEKFGKEIDYKKLEGLWRLAYTTAPDVVPSSLPVPRIGAIYQRFTSLEEGRVQNIIQAGDGAVLTAENGLTFTVDADFRPSGPRTINLTFKGAQVGGVRVSDGVEALLAPALLPRTSLQHRMLLAIKEFTFKVPLSTPSNVQQGERRRQAEGRYMLSYIDDDTLIGRAQAGGGSFVFRRADLADL